MSTHDRGAFGQLLAELTAKGFVRADFSCALTDPESDRRWSALGFRRRPTGAEPHATDVAHGRTGEEALRRLVEKVR